MASFTPPAGIYLVNATATGEGTGGFFACRALDTSFFGSIFQPTPFGFFSAGSTPLAVAETGEMFASSPFSPIQERCFTSAAAGVVFDAGLTATQLNSVNGAAVKPAEVKAHRKPAHKFVIPKGIRGGKQSLHAAHSKG